MWLSCRRTKALRPWYEVHVSRPCFKAYDTYVTTPLFQAFSKHCCIPSIQHNTVQWRRDYNDHRPTSDWSITWKTHQVIAPYLEILLVSDSHTSSTEQTFQVHGLIQIQVSQLCGGIDAVTNFEWTNDYRSAANRIVATLFLVCLSFSACLMRFTT